MFVLVEKTDFLNKIYFSDSVIYSFHFTHTYRARFEGKAKPQMVWNDSEQ